MRPALLIRLRPAGPWRYGPGDGALDRIDTLYRSDRLYSAVTLAMKSLGSLDEWLDATVRAPRPALTFSSLFPFQGDTLFAAPPAVVWPPPASQIRAPNSVFLAKIRWKTARFVPLPVIESLITGGNILADQWVPDPESGCLLRRDRPSSPPFRTVMRKSAAVDRMTSISIQDPGSACVEFEPGAGLWLLSRFADERARDIWAERLQGSFRLLADAGFGARRSQGWGHSETPEFESGEWPKLLFPKLSARTGENTNGDSRFWLLSVYSPTESDRIDWNSGNYGMTVRGGRIEGPDGLAGAKKTLRMVTEGSVLFAPSEPVGAAVDVAPGGFAHPVYRSGLAMALELPVAVAVPEEGISEPSAEPEMPSEAEALPEPEMPTKPEPLPQPESLPEPEMPAEPEAAPEPESIPDPESTPEREPTPEPEVAPEAEHVPGADQEKATNAF